MKRLGCVILPALLLELAFGLFVGWGPLLMALGAGGLIVSGGFAVLDLRAWWRGRERRRVAYRRWNAWWYADQVRRRRP